MKISPKLLPIFLTIAFFAAPLFAQTTPSSARMVAPLGHISAGGRFAIMLPADPTAQRRITPSDGTRGGMQYFWRAPEGEFFVSFYDNASKPANPKQELEQLRDNFLSGVIKNGGKLLEKKDLTLDKNIGIEIKASLKSTETVIIRYYSVDKRVFIVSTRLNAKETGEKQIKVLDSFRVTDVKLKP